MVVSRGVFELQIWNRWYDDCSEIFIVYDASALT